MITWHAWQEQISALDDKSLKVLRNKIEIIFYEVPPADEDHVIKSPRIAANSEYVVRLFSGCKVKNELISSGRDSLKII